MKVLQSKVPTSSILEIYKSFFSFKFPLYMPEMRSGSLLENMNQISHICMQFGIASGGLAVWYP